MTSSNEAADSDWGSLADVPDSERLERMVSSIRELLAQPQEDRHRRLKAMAESEYTQNDEKLRRLTITRLRSLLTLSEEDARAFTGAYDAVMRELPANAAMRRVGMVQTLALEFSAEEEERLRTIIPTVFAGAPRRTTGLEVSGPPLRVEAERRKRPFWAFWRKS